MKTAKQIPMLILLLVCTMATAQVKTKIYSDGIPKATLDLVTGKTATVKITAPPEFDQLLQKQSGDDVIPSEYKGKFAIPVTVDIDVLKTANIREENGFIIHSLSLNTGKALNTNLQFGDFFLSEQSVLSIFTANELTDSITPYENNPNNIWATRIYQGGQLFIVLKTPVTQKVVSRLKIQQVGLGFRQTGGGYFGTPGASAACNINVTCPEGVGWDNERSSVALIVSNSATLCTGTLLMNTCSSSIPYLLTANHCLNGNVQNWVFQFQTWSNTCNPNGTFREDLQFNGCQLRANNAATDFALVQLNQTPPVNSGITYSGWNRNAAAATRTTGIHHPMGDLMKISHDLQAPVSVVYQTGASNHWRATFDQGIVQHGSSGSALYDQNHRIVGQLHGNQNNVCAIGNNFKCWCVTQIPSIGEYGRFDISWAGGGTAATRLSSWLDPANNGALTTNTTNRSALAVPATLPILNITGNPIICNTSDYSITNLPAGAVVTWSIPGSAGPVLLLAQNTPGPNQLRITNQKWYGITTTLTATISNLGCGVANQTRTLTIANDNSTSASGSHPYYQESCYFYNVYHASQSGNIVTNSAPVFVHQGCMVYVNLGDITGRTVSVAPGSGQPLVWGVGSTSYYTNTLYFQLPLGSGGIPFTFKVTGAGACFENTYLFFSYSNNGRYAFATVPNPVKNTLTITAHENEAFLEQTKTASGKTSLQFTSNIYDLNTNKLLITQQSQKGSLQQIINTSKLKTGYYVLQVIAGNETQTSKFFKE